MIISAAGTITNISFRRYRMISVGVDVSKGKSNLSAPARLRALGRVRVTTQSVTAPCCLHAVGRAFQLQEGLLCAQKLHVHLLELK